MLHAPPRITLRKVAVILTGTLILCFGFCMAIKARIGTGAWDAMLLSLSDATGITVGTFSIALSTLCIMGQIMLEKRRFEPRQFLQFLLVFFGGAILDFMNDVLFRNLIISHYGMRLLVAFHAYCFMALGVVIIMESNLIRSPLEGLCQIIADRCKMPMGRLRQWWDIAFIAVSLLISLLMHTKLNIREGTVLCMILFGPALDLLRMPVRNIIACIS